MSNQTLPKSSKKAKEAPTGKTQQSRQIRGRLYRRQTARVEERRDGKPLLFGWGKRLSRRQKNRIQTRAFWVFTIAAILAVVGVLGYSFYYINYAIPAQPIVTVDGQPIPQSLFRKFNFYETQYLSNQMAALQQQLTAAQQEAKSSDPKKAAEGNQKVTDLTTQQQTLTAQFTIPTVGAISAEDLVDDVLIQAQIPQLEAQGVPAAKLVASDKEINAKLAAFKKALLPATVTYSQFLSAAKMSDDDFRQILALLVRQDNMTSYLQSQIGPTRLQVHSWVIQVASQDAANKLLAKLKGYSAADLPAQFQNQAKRISTDVNTKSKGGDMGWIVSGDPNAAEGAIAEPWLFDPARKAGDLSPVIKIVNGEYNIYYISAVDPHRPLSSDTLTALKSNALTNWIALIKVSPQTQIGDIDSTKQADPNNFPSNLPAGAPANQSPIGQ